MMLFWQDKIDNYLDPIMFTLAYSFANSQLDRASIFKVPVVEGAMTNKTTELYLKMCARTPKDCVSNLQLQSYVLLDEEEVDTADAAIELVEGLHQKVKLNIRTTNWGEPAFDARLNLTIDSTVSLISLDQSCRVTSSNDTSSTIECHLESPLHQGQQSVVAIVLNPFATFKPVHCKLELAIANPLHEDSVVQESITFRRVKRAAIDLKV